jgi:ATP dependent DNA ligase-like protein
MAGVYAGRAGTGIDHAELERLWRRLQPLGVTDMPLNVPPPRDSRFGSSLVLSRVHWVRPELVAEVKFLAWTDDNLLRQVVYEGLREDKPAAEVRRAVPYPETRRTGATGCPLKTAPLRLTGDSSPGLPGLFLCWLYKLTPGQTGRGPPSSSCPSVPCLLTRQRWLHHARQCSSSPFSAD